MPALLLNVYGMLLVFLRGFFLHARAAQKVDHPVVPLVAGVLVNLLVGLRHRNRAVHFFVKVAGSSIVNSYLTVPASMRVKRSIRWSPSVDPL